MTLTQKFIVQPLIAYAYIKTGIMAVQGVRGIYRFIRRQLNP